MDETKKFGDFFDDEIIEVEPVEVEPSEIVVGDFRNSFEEKPEEQVHSAIDDLISKYNLPMKNYSVKEVLENIDKIDTDDTSFDLVASKIVQDYVGRVALRGIVTEASLVNKIFELMDRTTIDDLSSDSLLILSKAFEYQDKLFAVLDRYKKTGLTESLKHAADIKQEEENKEEKITLTPSEIKELVRKIQESSDKNKGNV